MIPLPDIKLMLKSSFYRVLPINLLPSTNKVFKVYFIYLLLSFYGVGEGKQAGHLKEFTIIQWTQLKKTLVFGEAIISI